MTRLGAIAMMVGAGLALALGGCGSSPSAATSSFHWWPSTPLPTPGEVALVSPSAAPPSAAPAAVGQGQTSGLGTATEQVNATAALTFVPGTTTAKSGDVVQWTNGGGVIHNVTFDTYPDLTSPTLQQGNTWQVKFTVAGSYAYHCTFHPGMNGQITVTG